MKIAVLTNGGYFARLILDEIFQSPQHQVSAVVVINGDYYGNTGLKSLWMVGRKTFWVYVLYKVFVHFFFRLLGIVQPYRAFDVSALAARHGAVPVLQVTSVNDERVLEFVRESQVDVLLSVSSPQRISSSLLAAASTAAINIHSSLLPKYAGLAPYYWVLVNGEAETGTTVHLMTEAFDEGDIIVQKKLAIPARCSAFGLFKMMSKAGSYAVVEAIDLLAGGFRGERQDIGAGTYCSHPTGKSYIELSGRSHSLITIRDVIGVLKGDSAR